jgi:hypothetical protein
VQTHGYPSFEEIREGWGELLATVHKHVTNLEKKGLLHCDAAQPQHRPAGLRAAR